MNVKKSIVILTVIAVFIILMAVFAVVSFPIADTVYDYNGYATTIKLGLDLSGGVSAVFNVVPDDYGDLEARVDGTVSSLQSLLVSEGYTEATVTKTQSGGNFSIRVEVPDVNNAEDLLDLIGTPARLQMTGEDYGDTLPADAEVFIEGSQHLESAYVTANTSSSSSSGFEYVVALRFNDAGTEAFAKLTDGTYENCYIYINGSKYSTVTINDQITDGNAIISSTSWANDYNAADEFATQLQAGAFGVTLEVSEVRNISPTLGSDAVRVALIAGGIGVGLIFVFMAVMYRGLGLAADIALAGAAHPARHCGSAAFDRYGGRRKHHHFRKNTRRIPPQLQAHSVRSQSRLQALLCRHFGRQRDDAHRCGPAVDNRFRFHSRVRGDAVYRYHPFDVHGARNHPSSHQVLPAHQQHQREVLRSEESKGERGQTRCLLHQERNRQRR